MGLDLPRMGWNRALYSVLGVIIQDLYAINSLGENIGAGETIAFKWPKTGWHKAAELGKSTDFIDEPRQWLPHPSLADALKADKNCLVGKWQKIAIGSCPSLRETPYFSI